MTEGELPGAAPFVRVEDDAAVFEWQIADTSLHVRITNKSSRADAHPEWLVVLLDCAEYVDPDGETHDLVPKYGSGNPPHLIEPGGRRAYVVFPADYMTRGTRIRTASRALLGDPRPHRVTETPEELRELYKGHVGKTFRIRLPVRVGTVVYRYEFAMGVSKVEPYLARDLF